MKSILLICLLFSSQLWGHNKEATDHNVPHAHSEGAKLIDGESNRLNSDRLNKFIANLKNHKVAVVNVKGMVCDFCARGIQKAFQKSDDINKVDVDLDLGKVLLAFKNSATIDFEEISKKIQSNGQTAISMEIIKI